MSAGVQRGGALNSYRVKYSPETHQLLKVMMDEVKMTTMQRQQVKETMNRGESLPTLRPRRARPTYVDENLFDLKRNYYFMKRSQNQIAGSGAYERDQYRSLHPTVNIDQEKERLRSIMTYGKNKKPQTKKPAKKSQPEKTLTPEERLDELIFEVEDRLQFLRTMESLGQGRNYEHIIKQEIAAKLREMEQINKNSTQPYESLMEKPKKSKISEVIVWD